MCLKLLFMTLIITVESMSLQSSRTYSFTRPTIVNKEEAYDAEIGSNFNLTCQTYANDTEKINFDLSWDVSDEKDLRIFRDSAQKISNNLWLTKLYFKNVSYADEGGYNCTLKIGRLAQFNDSVILRVKATEHTQEKVLAESEVNRTRYVIVPEKEQAMKQNPFPMFSKSQQSVKYGTPVNVSCTVKEVPEISVTFSYKRCIHSKDCKGDQDDYLEVPGKIKKFPSLTTNNTPALTYTVETQFFSPGDLQCIAKNYFGEWKASQHICVTESPTGLSISEPHYHDRGVSIKCEASICEYLGSPQWHYKSVNGVEKLPNRHVEYTRGPFYAYAEATIEILTSGNAGVYICIAKTRTGGKDSANITVEPMSSQDQSYTIALSLSLAVITAIAAGSMYLVIKYNRKTPKPEVNELQEMPTNKISDYFNVDLIDPKWKVPSSCVNVKNMVGTGFFSHVYHAEAIGISPKQEVTKVAVKIARDRSNFKEIWNEFQILERANSHPHIVNLLGVVLDTPVKYEIYLVVEYCRHGSLRKFLRAKKGRLITCREPSYQGYSGNEDDYEYYPPKVNLPKNITLLLSFAYQISRGMQWLSYRDVLHGDLATRNVLLADKNIVKICDFGLARVLKDNYVVQKPRGASVPLKWMSIEALDSMEFSKESDVWAFGVVLWEIFSFGESPYPDLTGRQEILQFLMKGERLQKPAVAPVAVYELMLLCWNPEPEDRPSFSYISKKLAELLPGPHLEYLHELEDKYAKVIIGVEPPASVIPSASDEDDESLETETEMEIPDSDYYATEEYGYHVQRY